MRNPLPVTAQVVKSRLPLIAGVLLLAGCGQADLQHVELVSGRLENPAITEASGLACPGGETHWLMNDGGGPVSVFRIDTGGGDLGEVRIDGARNVDWEDLAVVERAGRIKLLVADVGDNAAVRDTVSLYLLPLPAPGDVAVAARERIEIRLPTGARDVEAVAVDNDAQVAYLLTKRSMPAELYSAPLAVRPEPVEATFLGTITSLPSPPAVDLRLAPIRNGWYWQPTAMDFSRDGRRALILTYLGLYLFTREADADWITTLNGDARFFRLPPNATAESACLTDDAVLVTFEGRYAPIYRIPFDAAGWSD